MIGQIILQVFKGSPIYSELLKVDIVVGCLFRSFNEYTQNLINRIMTNGGKIKMIDLISQVQINESMEKEMESKYEAILNNLVKLQILSQRGEKRNAEYKMSNTFISTYEMSLQKPLKRKSLPLEDQEYDEEFFNILALLQEHNKILSECKLSLSSGKMTKETFDFIRLPISQKILILIKSYLTFKRHSIDQNLLSEVLYLSLMSHKSVYEITAKNQSMICELETLRLVKRVKDNKCFVINKYIEKFTFPSEHLWNEKLFQCSINIEPNFKVYVQLSTKHHNFKLLCDILHALLQIDQKQNSYSSGFMVGTITKQKMSEIFSAKITVEEYLSFFIVYVDRSKKQTEDVSGSWRNIPYLRVGESDENWIPNNVKQELQLWHSILKKQGENYMLPSVEENESSQNDE